MEKNIGKNVASKNMYPAIGELEKKGIEAKPIKTIPKKDVIMINMNPKIHAHHCVRPCLADAK